MIDAYTIGITLALEDGVSDGIVAIRRDLAALDAAIADSAGQLLTLRKLAANMALPMLTGQTVQRALLFARLSPDKKAGQPTAATADALPIVPSIVASELLAPAQTAVPTPPILEAPSAPQRSLTSSLPPPLPAAERSVLSAVPRQVMPLAVAPSTVQSATPMPNAVPVSVPQPALPASRTAHAPDAPPPPPRVIRAAPQPQPEARGEGGQSLDFTAIARALALPKLASPGENPQQLDRLTPTQAPPVVPPQIITAAVPFEPSPHAVAPQHDARPPTILALSQKATPRDVSMGVHSPWKSAAPVVSVQTSTTASAVTNNDLKQSAPAPEQVGAQESDRPAYAELHLDGAALGRWVTRHLERQVTRPQSGATGFDPRVTPSWSGAPIGN